MKRSLIAAHRRRIAAAVSIGLIIGTVAMWGQTAFQQTSREMVLTVGKSIIVSSSSNIERIAIGYGEVAEARAVGPKEVLIDGKAPGETSLIIWQEGGNKLFFDVSVRPNTTNIKNRVETVRRQIQEQLPGQKITANFENDSIFLSGTAKDLVSVERARQAIAATVGRRAVNLVFISRFRRPMPKFFL